jgi:hypothetical protein
VDLGAHVVAVIDLLLTIGYIDGGLHQDEEAFIRRYIDRLIQHVANSPDEVAAWRAHVDSTYSTLRAEIEALASEIVPAGDDHFVRTRLKVRAVGLFRGFPPADQKVALELLAAVTATDGTISAEEAELHNELIGHFHAPPQLVSAPETARPSIPPAHIMRLDAPRALHAETKSHPLLDVIEQPYHYDRATRHAQLHRDYDLIFQAIVVWERQRARGNGRLVGITDTDQLPPGTKLLDGHLYVSRPDVPTEVIVLGDLHGSYSCLKAALLQSSFIERAERHERDPANNPPVMLALLGDYIDRGRFGFEGVTRAALQLLVRFPEHVILLRGNHELLMRMGPGIISMVNPAEATPQLAELAPVEILEAYKHLFDSMPNAWIFGRTLFAHAGIPRDDTITERMRDLSSLSDPVMRFEMLWSDPAQTDHVPIPLQRQTPRFNFGHEQFRAFMERIGCHTMIRGHESVESGFHTAFKLPSHRLYTLFSAGGRDNADLPQDSRYRNVTPMALTIHAEPHGSSTAVPWPIEYEPFVTGQYNGFYR